ncbi:MAG: hypothetical protein Kow0089_23450 [Desulfobulbaceae bacterium]
MEDIDLTKLENVFVPAGREGKIAVKVTFKPNHRGHNRKKTYLFNSGTNDARDPADTSIRDGNRLKSFLTCKHLLANHHRTPRDQNGADQRDSGSKEPQGRVGKTMSFQPQFTITNQQASAIARDERARGFDARHSWLNNQVPTK